MFAQARPFARKREVNEGLVEEAHEVKETFMSLDTSILPGADTAKDESTERDDEYGRPI